MSPAPAPARRPTATGTRRRPAAELARSARAQQTARRRRQRHFARRRRDLLQDAGAGLLLAVLLISATAGLGVVALLDVPLVLALLASVVVERTRAPRRGSRSRRPQRRRER